MDKEKHAELISHSSKQPDFAQAYNEAKNKIIKRGDLEYVSVERQLEILEQLSLFSFGRFILVNKGWDGFWTNYAVMHQFTGRLTGKNSDGKLFSDMEKFLLDRSPIVLATQQRFAIFRKIIQEMVTDDCNLASIPCGMMGEMLTLDYSLYKNIRLTGIDLDENSLKLAAEYSEKLNARADLDLVLSDAWDLEIEDAFDIIASNGLNIYEPAPNQIIKLYESFYKALKSGGYIITSTITPPPSAYNKSPWLMENINKDDLLLEQIIFKDIIGVSWTCFRTVPENIKMMESAGFKSIEVIYDRAHIFPTFIGKKLKSKKP